MNYTLVMSSQNVKTGPIPVSMTSAESCPISCPLNPRGKDKNGNGAGCYASVGPMAWTWNKLTQNKIGVNFSEFISAVKEIPVNQIWRHNQAGDLMGKENKINSNQLKSLVTANKGKKGFTYTHKPVTGQTQAVKNNRKIIKFANNNGFTINLSANNISEVDKLVKLNIGPVVVIVPENSPKTLFTKGGNKVITCPAVYSNVNCASCKLCSKQRSVVVAFPAHGTQKNKVNLIASSNI